jgi:plastocyanin
MKSRTQHIVIGVAAIVLLLAGGWFVLSGAGRAGEAWTVSMEPGKFSPAELEIRRDDRVTFVNRDTEPRWPASNLHPTHGIYPEFDPQESVPPGESWSFVFDRAGEWKYHDHNIPALRGIIRVRE